MYPLTNLALLLAAAVVADRDTRDVVELSSGKKITGRVVLELPDCIYVRVGSTERKLARDKVRSFTSVFRAQWKVLEKFKAALDSPAALLALADECKEHELGYTEELLCWRILSRDPNNAEAHTRLGHKERRGKWRFPGAGGALTYERAEKVRADFGKCWELRSEHFLVRCSNGLRATVDTLFDLEFFYHYAMRLWQVPLELREVAEPMKVYVYGDPKQYPSEGSNVGAYFQPGPNIVHVVGGKNGARPGTLFHEATHSFSYNTISGSARTRGKLPAWLDEGWAEYMTGVIQAGSPGKPGFREGARIEQWMRLVAGAEKPYDLHRVLNFQHSDYAASSKQGLKYAQGYALFHYMLHGTSDELRNKFFAYLRAAVDGKGQASTFRRMFRTHLDEIDEGYRSSSR